MLHIEETADKREGKHCFKEFDMAVYAKKTFAMYGGNEYDVRLECNNRLVGVMIDRFGKDVMIFPLDDEHFAIDVKVAVSMQFLHWVMALGSGVKVTSPPDVVEMIKEEIKRLREQYDVN